MSKTKQIIAAILAILGIGGGLAYSQLGGTPGNLPAYVATTSTLHILKSEARVLFATTSPQILCAARVVSTTGEPILITLSDDSRVATSAPNIGILQSASTTVSYEATTYGCGKMTVINAGAAATTIITVYETR